MQHKRHILATLHSKLAILAAILTLLLLVGFSFTAGSGTVHASSHASSSILSTRRVVGLNVDCGRLSPQVLKKAQAAGLCPKTGNSIKPFTTFSGNCGSASLFLTDNFNGGYPTVTLGAASSEGYMVSISWHVKWNNYDTGGQNGYGGSQGYFGDTWSHSSNPYTGVGQIFAVMDSLTVYTAYGYVCSGLQPWDYGFME